MRKNLIQEVDRPRRPLQALVGFHSRRRTGVLRIFDRVKHEAFGSLTGRKIRAESVGRVDQEKCTQYFFLRA